MMANAMAPNEAMLLVAALWVCDVWADRLLAPVLEPLELAPVPEEDPDLVEDEEVELELILEEVLLLLLLLLPLEVASLKSGWALGGQVMLYSGEVFVLLSDTPKLGLAPVSDMM